MPPCIHVSRCLFVSLCLSVPLCFYQCIHSFTLPLLFFVSSSPSYEILIFIPGINELNLLHIRVNITKPLFCNKLTIVGNHEVEEKGIYYNSKNKQLLHIKSCYDFCSFVYRKRVIQWRYFYRVIMIMNNLCLYVPAGTGGRCS